MPRIFDNIDNSLLPSLKEALEHSEQADFCVGYFNLRGWKEIDESIEKWSGVDGNACRLLIGMHQSPEKSIREKLFIYNKQGVMDNAKVIELKKELAREFKTQLTIGVPNNKDEEGLRRLSKQIRSKKVVIKLFLRHFLHAKLYLLHRSDPINPKVGFLGSSNLTFAGLSMQGELNVDVMDADACQKLSDWFNARWEDRWCIDISDELADIIENSWASETLIPPYHVYLKMAYHLSREARHGQSEFKIPKVFGNQLFDFQTSAVKVAAHHLNRRGGVIVGDVVGLGKSIIASALLKIVEDTDGRSLIICPKNLVGMWEDYVDKYDLSAKIVPLSRVDKELPELRRYRTVLIDESHNLRNRESKRYKIISDYIDTNDCRCILLSATPYNKSFLDLSSQLRLFVQDDRDIGIRPEAMIRSIGGETEFVRKHQCAVRSVLAFEKSDMIDDWRDLMRLFMIRRTRGFIIQNYAKIEEKTKRKYITFQDGTKSFFPDRVPKTIKFEINDEDPNDIYARAYSEEVLTILENLKLPRYGLGNYLSMDPQDNPSTNENKIIEGLGKAGSQLMGFCRSNLFKRLESGGPAFLKSIERQIIRNYVFIYAIENSLKIPIGSQNAELLDYYDEDMETPEASSFYEDTEYNIEDETIHLKIDNGFLHSHAKNIYNEYLDKKSGSFKWLNPTLFTTELRDHLLDDVENLMSVLSICGKWNETLDNKLKALIQLLKTKHTNNKFLIFTQYADTARYLANALSRIGMDKLEVVTGGSKNPTQLVWRFSPKSNDKEKFTSNEGEINILITTDILSEGQNLQDCSNIINFDLPWAIIRLIQRAGRVDRIGQQAENIFCYSFLPADGIEKIIRLRSRVKNRLLENREVVGSDEAFFEDDKRDNPIQDLYSEKKGILDGEDDGEVDLASLAYQIWKNATDENPNLKQIVSELPNVVYATKGINAESLTPEGTIVYVKTPDESDSLIQVNKLGEIVTQSPLAILKIASCLPDEKPLEKAHWHHDMVLKGVEHLLQTEKTTHGALGRPSGARFKTYDRLKRLLEKNTDEYNLFFTEDLALKIERALTDIYQYPLFQSAIDIINRQLKTGISDRDLADLVVGLRDDGKLSMLQDQDNLMHDMQIIGSMGLKISR